MTTAEHALTECMELTVCGAEVCYPDDDYPEAYAVCSLEPNGDRLCHYTGSSWADAQRVCAETNNKIKALCARLRERGE